MSDATLSLGPITKRVGTAVRQFRLVAINAEDKAVHAQPGDAVFGAITMNRDPEDPRSRDLVAVHYAPAGVMLEVVGGDATAIRTGHNIYAGEDGKVTTDSTSGDPVGVAMENGVGGRVLVNLKNLPQGVDADAGA